MRPFVGTWRNTDATSQSVVALAFEPEQALVHAWSGIDLGAGSIETFGGIADPTPLAFTARLPGAGMGEVLLQGNINRGLMILATYQAGRFSREFLARRDTGFVEFVPRSSSAGASVDVANPEPREFIGRWLATGDEGDLRGLEIEASGTGLFVRVRGSGRRLPAAWPTGESRLFGYHDEGGHDTLLLLARFELAEGRSELQIKVTNGTAVVACFHTRRDRSWFTREFLWRP